MLDLTRYSDQELSLHVFNDEYLYVERHDIPYLLALCAEEFLFTEEQLSVLLADLKDEEE